jgi:hypothetical protein
MVLSLKLWIVVFNYGLINEDVGVFTSLEDARQGYREYTGFEWEPERRYKEVGDEQYSEYYEQCDIFEGDIG